MTQEWDAVVIGGGAAGLSAAQMLGRSRRRTLVIDGGAPRNRFAAHMHGVLGLDGVDPAALLETGREEVRRYGVEVVSGTVARLDDEGALLRVVRADGREDRARVVVIATGLVDDLPAVPGLAKEWGRTVLHCPYCHGWEVAGRRLAVLATSPVSLHQAQLVRQLSSDVTVFTSAIEPLGEDAAARLRAQGVRIVRAQVVAARRQADHLVLETADGASHVVDAVFTGDTPVIDLGFADGLALRRTDAPGRPLEVDAMGRTSHARVLAAGNAIAPFGNVPISMGSGSMAGAGANTVLGEEDFDRAVAARTELRNAAWEQRYVERDRHWSGDVNATVADVVRDLEPGSALDVGSGEGGDVVWLAEHGWRSTGVDVAPTAVRRAAELARQHGVAVDLRVGDGAAAVDGRFDLVLASFLHSWDEDFPRLLMLRDAADRVAAGGHLLVVSHVAPPPGSADAHHDHPALRTPEEELVLLALDMEEWETVIAETRPRPGAPETEDGVLLLRRR